MMASYVSVKEVSFRVSSADSSQFIVRIHWAIPFIPNSAIADTLNETCRECKVLSVVNERMSLKGSEGVATGIRSAIMTGNSRDVPHTMLVVNPATCKSFEVLLVMAGCKPLRCRREGHFRRDCKTKYCRFHAEFGHAAEGCSAERSYASAARGGSDEPRDNDRAYVLYCVI